MNAKVALKLLVVGTLIVFVGQWLRGHDVLTGAILVLVAAIILLKIVFALIYSRRGRSGGGWQRPPDALVPRPPGGRPPALSAAKALEHEPSG